MNHRVYTQDDGLPSHVNSITQTPDGYLWLGTGSGLFRFDGVHFDRVAADQLLSSNITVAVAASPDGDLWIGYLNGGMSRLRDGAVANYRPSAGGPPDAIGGITTAPRGGGVWVNANFFPWHFNGNRWSKIPGDWKESRKSRVGVVGCARRHCMGKKRNIRVLLPPRMQAFCDGEGLCRRRDGFRA